MTETLFGPTAQEFFNAHKIGVFIVLMLVLSITIWLPGYLMLRRRLNRRANASLSTRNFVTAKT
jgi:hypothetical protein